MRYSKDVAENKPGSYVGLGGAILRTVIPVAGDAGKAAIKANKEAIAETVEAALKQTDEAAPAAVKTAEQQAAEAAAKAAAEQAAQITKQYDEIAQSGHAVQRHGEDITTIQLDNRAIHGIDPASGTTNDVYLKDINGNPLLHRAGKDATKFTSKEALVKAEEYVKDSSSYQALLTDAQKANDNSFAVKDLKLEDVYGANYNDHVAGKKRIGTKNNSIGTNDTDFTDGTVTAVFKKDASGKWNLHTM